MTLEERNAELQRQLIEAQQKNEDMRFALLEVQALLDGFRQGAREALELRNQIDSDKNKQIFDLRAKLYR